MRMRNIFFIAVWGTLFLLLRKTTAQGKICQNEQFSCRDNSYCIPNSWKCDGVSDCPDSSDESSCVSASQTLQSCGSDSLFRCGDGKCILSSWTCDNDNDCADNSDESTEICTSKPSCEFTCNNGKCLASSWVCDKFDDCGDGSDEQNCDGTSSAAPTTVTTTASTTPKASTAPPSRCMKNEFECRIRSSCIPMEWKCDGTTDCEDGTDEEDCGYSTIKQPTLTTSRCGTTEFYCDDKCIPGTWKCDQFDDCYDKTDEQYCGDSTTSSSSLSPAVSSTTTKKQTTPTTETTTPPTTEGLKTERLTSKRPTTERPTTKRPTTESPTTSESPVTDCLATEFRCPDDGTCIKREWLCDKISDCQDSSDEQNCENRVVTTPKAVRGLAEPKVDPTTKPSLVCPDHQFLCGSGLQCTFLAWRCDGDKDCGDGSDEEDCEEPTKAVGPPISTCGRGYFQCLTSRRCIADHWKCDKERDCRDGSDELGCVETVSLIVAAQSKIVKLPEDLSSSENVMTRLHAAVAVDIDMQTQEIFWSDVKRKEIRKGNVNGVFSQAIISSGLGTVEGIAVDWVARNIYWTDSLLSTIEVASMRGQHRTKLVSKDLSNPRAVAVHPSGYLFWTEWGGQPKISRISMDGKPETRSVLIEQEIAWPNALSIDYQKANLWWADAKLGKIERCNLDGTNRRVVTEQNVGAPFAIAVSARHVYWANWENSRVERIEKDSWNKNHIQSQSFSQQPLGITLIDGGKHEAVYTECSVNNGGCSHLCLLSSEHDRYSCRCPGTMQIDRNGRTCLRRIAASCSLKQFHCDGNRCIDASKRCNGEPDCDDGTDEHYCLATAPRLVFTDRKKYVGLCTLQGYRQCSNFKEIEKASSVIGVDVDVKNGIVFWADSIKNAIFKSALRPNGDLLWTKTVTNTYVYTPQGLAFDWVTNKIYWIDRRLRKIEVIDTDGTLRYTVVSSNLHRPRSIALHPGLGYLYWTDWGRKPYLARIDMDGNPSSRRMMVETSIKEPNAVTIDYKANDIYWVDSHYQKIEKMDVAGGHRKYFLMEELLHHPFALTFYDRFLYWSDWHLQGIFRVDSRTRKQDSIVKKPVAHPMELVVFDKNRQPAMRNPCAVYNGGCSHICLISQSPTRRSCKCPLTMRLKKDGKTCESLYHVSRQHSRTNSLFDIGLL